MTTSALPLAPATVGRRAAALRVASRAALVAAIAWLVQPVLLVLTLTTPSNSDPDQTLAQWRSANPFTVVGGLSLIVVAIALIVLITQVEIARGDESPSPTVRVAAILGIGGSIALLAAGAIDLTLDGLSGAALAEIPGASDGSRWLAHQAVDIVHEGLRLVSCIGFAIWIVVLALTGRRAGLVGRGLQVAAWIAAILIVVPGAATGLLTGMNAILVVLIPLAVGLARRARTAR